MLGRPRAFLEIRAGVFGGRQAEGIDVRDWALASWLKACISLRFMAVTGKREHWEERLAAGRLMMISALRS